MTNEFQSFDYEFQVFTQYELWCVYIIILKRAYKVCVEAGRIL